MSAHRKSRAAIDSHPRSYGARSIRALYFPAAYIDRTVAVVVDRDEFIVGALRSPRAEFADDYRREVVVRNCYDASTFLNNCAIDICYVDEEYFVCFDIRIADNCQFESIDLLPRENCLLHEAMGQIVIFTNCCGPVLRGNIKGYRLLGGN